LIVGSIQRTRHSTEQTDDAAKGTDLHRGVVAASAGVAAAHSRSINADDDEETVMRQMAATQRRRLAQLCGGCGVAGFVLMIVYHVCFRRRASADNHGDDGAVYSNLGGEVAARSWSDFSRSWGWGGRASLSGDNELLAPTCCALDISDSMSQAGSTISQEQLDNWDDFELDDDDDTWSTPTPSRTANEDEGLDTENSLTTTRQQLLV